MGQRLVDPAPGHDVAAQEYLHDERTPPGGWTALSLPDATSFNRPSLSSFRCGAVIEMSPTSSNAGFGRNPPLAAEREWG
jgi:hypothetical protein